MSELAVVPKQELLTRKDLDDWLMGSDTKLTDKQKAMFYNVALAFNLNPVKREIYAVAYGNNFNVITGYEVYLKRAERTGKLEYWDAGVKKDGSEWVGWCKVKRTDRSESTTIEAWFNEYNQGNRMWKEKPRTMIRKVAIAQAFRMSFPDELGGMPYTSDEMGEVETYKPHVQDMPSPDSPEGKALAKGKGRGAPRSSPDEALSKPPAETPESWDSRNEDLQEIRVLIEATNSDEAKILEWAKIKTLDDISKDTAGILLGKLYDKRSKLEEQESEV